MRFALQAIGWGLQTVWTFFRRLPRWLQILIYVWLAIALMAKACTPPERHRANTSRTDEARDSPLCCACERRVLRA